MPKPSAFPENPVPPCPSGCEADWIVNIGRGSWACVRCGSTWKCVAGRPGVEPWISELAFEHLCRAVAAALPPVAQDAPKSALFKKGTQ